MVSKVTASSWPDSSAKQSCWI